MNCSILQPKHFRINKFHFAILPIGKIAKYIPTLRKCQQGDNVLLTSFYPLVNNILPFNINHQAVLV